MGKEQAWFESWFDSNYYHLLYKHRDSAEAEAFLSALIERLEMDTSGKLLDIACGRGRHSVYFNRRGFDVTGFDISPSSIEFDRQFENERLHFHVHDMRLPFKPEAFDYAVNLFSSFGYFEEDAENQRSLQSAADCLKRGGTFVFDYANMEWVLRHGLSSSIEVHDGITFEINKAVTTDFVTKEISFKDDGKEFRFEERLKKFDADRLQKMIQATGLKILHVFGDYSLQPFEKESSKRIVIAAIKK